MANPPRTLTIPNDSQEPVADEIARLELLRCLTMGAAHSLNNAFTAILGETLCLADERKTDPLVAEVCGLIQSEVERCARLTRAVSLRVQRRESVLEESNVATLVRQLEPLLRETVSRCVSIELDVPDRGVVVRGPAEDLEVLLLLVAHRLAGMPGRSAALRIALGPHDANTAELQIEVVGGDAKPIAAEPANPWNDLVADAEVVLGARHGVCVEARGDGCVGLVFSVVS